LVFWVSSCGSPDNEPYPNRPPQVRITGGPVEGSRNSYTARVYWAGWDEDGIITQYEYTVDPPPEFTEAEIAHPEEAPGLLLEVRYGTASNRDTLRVSKVSAGRTIFYDWVETPEFSRSFAFRTTDPESVSAGGALTPINEFSGVHRIYVRALDNQGAHSDPDHLGYTALSVTPSSEILQPDVKVEISNLGTVLTVRWDGLDPDAAGADKKPAGFLFKLLRLDTLQPPIPIVAVSSPDVLFSRGGPWQYQSADTLNRLIPLGSPGQYLFGVRAVDAAGAVEPFLNWGRNAFKFQSLPNGGKPNLTVSGNTISTHRFRGVGEAVDVEVPAGAKLTFRWSATAEDYGGTIEGYSWGMDIPDLSAEGPESGWSGWGNLLGNSQPIVFANAGLRVLYIRTRDVAGGLTVAALVLHIIEFTRDRDVLLVDDSYDDLTPRDNQHDAFWNDMLTSYTGYPTGTVDTYDAYGPGDRQVLSASAPSLEILGRHKLVIWECRGSGYNARTALVDATAITPRLATYLTSGGMLWLGGRMNVGATFAAEDGFTADLSYPKSMQPGDFAYDFLKLHSTRISNDRGLDSKNNLSRVTPFPGRPALYDTMTVDIAKFPAGRLGASYADAVFDPIFAEAEQNPPFRGDIDTLYAYGAEGPVFLNLGSIYQGRLTALRWHDPDPDRQQGRIQWFGFPMYYFQNNEARETFRRSLDWFFQELPSAE
jgi:hypothetical protein